MIFDDILSLAGIINKYSRSAHTCAIAYILSELGFRVFDYPNLLDNVHWFFVHYCLGSLPNWLLDHAMHFEKRCWCLLSPNWAENLYAWYCKVVGSFILNAFSIHRVGYFFMGSTRRLDRLLAIEREVHQLWSEERPFEVEAGEMCARDETFFVTFPYPYMNGRLHLGHAFSLTKSEFRARFERLNGKHVLWPFAFHCTGMPIAASADKIRNELRDAASADPKDGLAVNSKSESAGSDLAADNSDSSKPAAGSEGDHGPSATDLNATAAAGEARVFASRKSKTVSKTGGAKTQTEILLQLGIPAEEVPRFADARHWLEYFPPLGRADLEEFGLGVDWRRSFITTDANPYYDRFVQWQFLVLRERQRLKFGLRPAVFSRVEEQPCADHDRASGEGVGPLALNVLKLRVVEPAPALAALLAPHPELGASLLALTAPQSGKVIGKPNFFLNEDAEFGVYLALPSRLEAADLCDSAQESFLARKQLSLDEAFAECREVYIMHPRCAENILYQGLLPSDPETQAPHCLGTLSGAELCECVVQLQTPTAPSPPLLHGQFVTTGRIEKGPRITVASGPAQKDEPADAALVALASLREAGLCLTIHEPEKPVISRSGDECVVALCNQWYSDFGDPEWTAAVLEHVRDAAAFECYGARAVYERTAEWLDGWACSRNYGLGTFVPWELERGNKIVIESLSDSTIYWAYYTIAHLLQGDMFGTKPGRANLTPDMLTKPVFDYVFCQTDTMPPAPKGVDAKALDSALREMRHSFEYWYPMRLRCSGKDLVQNHLTMALFHHAAIWPHRRDLWPRAFYVNGHILLDTKKMSKGTGNFLTLEESVAKFSADATRVALADAGDSSDDANFEQATAVAALMKLYLFLQDVEAFVDSAATLRADAKRECDLLFEYECELLATKAHQAYGAMLMRDANKYAFYEQLSLRDWYKQLLAAENAPVHRDSYRRWIETVTLTLSPIAPCLAEYVWSKLLAQPQLVVRSSWPSYTFHTASVPGGPLVPTEEGGSLHLQYMILTQVADDVRKALEKSKKSVASPSAAALPKVRCYYAADGFDEPRRLVLAALRTCSPEQLADKTWMKQLKNEPKFANLGKRQLPALMGFASYRVRLAGELGATVAFADTLPFSEGDFLEKSRPYLAATCQAEIEIVPVHGDDLKCVPGQPTVALAS